MRKNPRVGVYTRVSTTDQSTENQMKSLEDYCISRGWSQPIFYNDSGVSGMRAKRPGLNDLLADCRSRKIDIVIVYKLDRFFRSLKHIVSVLGEFEEIGIKFISMKENIDMTTSTGKLMFHIIAAFAEFEAEIIRERVTAGIHAKIKQGVKWGRKKKIDREKVRSLREEGLSVAKIAKHLKCGTSVIDNILYREEVN